MTIGIPTVPKEKIEKLAETIKPLVRTHTGTRDLYGGRPFCWTCFTFCDRMDGRHATDSGVLHRIEPVDLFNIAFMWSPKFTGDVSDESLITLGDITTYHTYGYTGFFKPSVGEVLAQIPQSYLDQGVNFFEIIDYPRNVEDLEKNRTALDMGYHVAKTRLYRAARPERAAKRLAIARLTTRAAVN